MGGRFWTPDPQSGTLSMKSTILSEPEWAKWWTELKSLVLCELNRKSGWLFKIEKSREERRDLLGWMVGVGAMGSPLLCVNSPVSRTLCDGTIALWCRPRTQLSSNSQGPASWGWWKTLLSTLESHGWAQAWLLGELILSSTSCVGRRGGRTCGVPPSVSLLSIKASIFSNIEEKWRYRSDKESLFSREQSGQGRD